MRIPVLFLVMVFPLAAVEIRYTATDLADVTPGEDLWRYDYRLLDVTFAANQGFSIFFDPSLVISINTPPLPVAPGWDVIILQPLPAIPSDGLYDALALVGNPSTAGLFPVEFVFAGPGIPGSQPYTLNQFDSSGQFTGTFGEGQTVPESFDVPEPETEALVFAGACLFAALLCQKRRTAQRRRAETVNRILQ